jgi:hypothetical protein
MCCDHDGSELKRLFASAHAAGPCPFGLSFFNRSMEIQRSGQLSFFFFSTFDQQQQLFPSWKTKVTVPTRPVSVFRLKKPNLVKCSPFYGLKIVKNAISDF